MIDDIVGSNGSRFIIAAAAVALGLLCLVAVLWFLRNRPSSPFVRGGKNRQPRLAVLDAAAIDTRRRLVLVRRDDVEHLIMIGGPTDVVIESRIVQQPAAAAAEPQTALAKPAPERRTMPQPAEGRRLEVRPQPQPSQPVSAMGQVLYGETAETPTPRNIPAPAARLQPEPAPRPPALDRPVAGPVAQRPATSAPANSGTAPVIETARTPEDILDAARSRVLPSPAFPTSQPVAPPTPKADPISAYQAPLAASSGPKKELANDFERFLDAEITGDLGRLAAGQPPLPAADIRSNIPAPAPSPRQEPRLEASAGQRQEPSLEEEMNRMLNEMAVNRKG